MSRNRVSSGDRERRRLDAAVILLTVPLGVVTIAVIVGGQSSAAVESPGLDFAIGVGTTLVGAAVAILAWVRWRDSGESVALFESAAFLAVTTVNTIVIGSALAGFERQYGLSPEAPDAGPVYVQTITQLAAALLLFIGAAYSLARRSIRWPPLLVGVLPTLILVGLAVILLSGGLSLHPTSAWIAEGLRGNQTAAITSGPIALAQVGAFALFIVGAILFRRLYLRDRSVSHAFLAVGLVAAAFSEVHVGLQPQVVVGVVTSADMLRLGFFAALFMGIQAGIEADLGALRRANAELRRLRDVEAANAALAERTRLAREIHDGLAQDLWYAKLKQSLVGEDPSLGESTRAAASEALSAIDAALAEARQAVVALRADSSTGFSLEDDMRSSLAEFGDRFGIRTEFDADGTWPWLPPRSEAELLRIVQEALTNVRRHADATVVRVRAECDGLTARITVGDNGRGFDPARVRSDRYGLRGMRERAELIDARLSIDSRPRGGTRVTIEVAVPDGVS